MLKVTRGQFDALVERHPAATMELARMIVRRQQRVRSLRTPQAPSTILVAPVALQAPFEEFLEKLSQKLSVFGPVARVNAVMCKGCGACASVCPTGAMTACPFTDEQVAAMVRAALAVEQAGD